MFRNHSVYTMIQTTDGKKVLIAKKNEIARFWQGDTVKARGDSGIVRNNPGMTVFPGGKVQGVTNKENIATIEFEQETGLIINLQQKKIISLREIRESRMNPVKIQSYKVCNTGDQNFSYLNVCVEKESELEAIRLEFEKIKAVDDQELAKGYARRKSFIRQDDELSSMKIVTKSELNEEFFFKDKQKVPIAPGQRINISNNWFYSMVQHSLQQPTTTKASNPSSSSNERPISVTQEDSIKKQWENIQAGFSQSDEHKRATTPEKTRDTTTKQQKRKNEEKDKSILYVGLGDLTVQEKAPKRKKPL